jgi:hypothetical protein
VGQDAPPSVTSEFSCLIILTNLTVSGPTITPDQLLNILRL